MVGGVSVGGCKIVVMSRGGCMLGLTPSVLAKSFRMRCSSDGVPEKQRTGTRGRNWLKFLSKGIFHLHGSGALVGVGPKALRE